MRNLDAATLRRLAVQGDVDPRSLRRLLRGEPVRGAAGHRARRVLVESGYLNEPVTGEQPPGDAKK